MVRSNNILVSFAYSLPTHVDIERGQDNGQGDEREYLSAGCPCHGVPVDSAGVDKCRIPHFPAEIEAVAAARLFSANLPRTPPISST